MSNVSVVIIYSPLFLLLIIGLKTHKVNTKCHQNNKKALKQQKHVDKSYLMAYDSYTNNKTAQTEMVIRKLKIKERRLDSMKFQNILDAVSGNTKIKLTVKMFGVRFSTTRFPEYFLEKDEMENLFDREVTNIYVSDGCLEIILADENSEERG